MQSKRVTHNKRKGLREEPHVHCAGLLALPLLAILP